LHKEEKSRRERTTKSRGEPKVSWQYEEGRREEEKPGILEGVLSLAMNPGQDTRTKKRTTQEVAVTPQGSSPFGRILKESRKWGVNPGEWEGGPEWGRGWLPKSDH